MVNILALSPFQKESDRQRIRKWVGVGKRNTSVMSRGCLRFLFPENIRPSYENATRYLKRALLLLLLMLKLLLSSLLSLMDRQTDVRTLAPAKRFLKKYPSRMRSINIPSKTSLKHESENNRSSSQSKTAAARVENQFSPTLGKSIFYGLGL